LLNLYPQEKAGAKAKVLNFVLIITNFGEGEHTSAALSNKEKIRKNSFRSL